MAKKKPGFENIVDESFNDGYQSEPELDVMPPAKEVDSAIEVETEPTPEARKLDEKELKKIWEKKDKDRTAEESALMLQALNSGDEKARKVVLEYEERSTYYITDVHRALIDIVSHEEDIKKNDVVVAALNAYFSEKITQSAKDLVVSRAIKKLERETSN